MGILSWRTLLKAWRYAVVGTFVLAAAITPSGDPISLLALSGPMVILCFIAVLIGWLFQRRKVRTASA
jgi:sec-independent protein translocase protein TatC